jgi:glycosyltransferase involved in cell wall biosynthesis
LSNRNAEFELQQLMDSTDMRKDPRGCVLIVTPQPFYEDRGTPIAVRYVARALSEIGIDVDLLAFPVGEDVSIKNVTVSRCANVLRFRHVPIGFSWRKIVLDASLWQSFTRLVASRRYDMVHAVEEAAYIAAAICPRFGQPFIYDMASAIPVELRRKPVLKSAPVQRMLAAVERRVFNSASRIVCSPGLAKYVHDKVPGAPVSEWQFPAHSRKVTRTEVESLRDQLRIRPDRRVLLYSGSFADYQGIDLLLNAFAQARQSNPELLLVCVGATEQELAVWSKRVPTEVDEHMLIIPRQPHDRIPAYIELADFLMLPRICTDNIPLKLFDYMASGKPIVATRQVADEPLLDDTRAFICDPTAESFASAMTRACCSPREAKAVGRASLQYAQRHFSWNPFVEFVRNTYAHAIADGREQGADEPDFAVASAFRSRY